MLVRNFCSREVVTVEPRASLREAALTMRNRHVGALVVVEGGKPAGLLTDRDIVVAVVAVPGARPEGIRVGDVLTRKLVTVQDNDDIFAAVQTMRQHGVRRLPVVTAEGELYGVITTADIVQLIATELGGLATALRKSGERETAERSKLQVP
ncbi:MAG TPA: CBS domain-containing protein [Burkholderiales bacterium]|nr:CBS domain-containing protein [Burkholderiales bacterium]